MFSLKQKAAPVPAARSDRVLPGRVPRVSGASAAKVVGHVLLARVADHRRWPGASLQERRHRRGDDRPERRRYLQHQGPALRDQKLKLTYRQGYFAKSDTPSTRKRRS